MRTRAATALAAAALTGAAVLATPTAGLAASTRVDPDDVVQYVTPNRVVAHDARYALAPDSDRTYRLALPELARARAVLVPCWGFDLVGPGVDLAAASLHPFGWLFEPERAYRNPRAVKRDDGWYLPESDAVVGLQQLADGAACRSVGWSTFVSASSGVASVAETRRARRQNRIVRIRHPRRTVRAAPANTRNDGAATVPLAGLARRPHTRVSEVVVRVVTGALPGPTTITLHARVVLPR